MAAKYRFKTIMASEKNREEFTKLRDSFSGLRVTDKELFQAILENVNLEEVCSTVRKMKADIEHKRELDKIKKLEQKLAAKIDQLNNNSYHDNQTEEAAKAV